MQTIRRYANELYPEAGEYEVRALSVEVPCLYARAIGYRVQGTSWYDLLVTPEGGQRSLDRTLLLLAMQEKALLADSLLQGLSGDEAWAWAEEHCDDDGKWVYERAVHYGVRPELIKPYPCGPEPDHHEHMSSTGNILGFGFVTRVKGREDECVACCEPESSE